MVQLNIEESLILIIDVQERLLNAVFNKDILLNALEEDSKIKDSNHRGIYTLFILTCA